MIKNLFFDTFVSEIQQLGIKFYIEEEDEGKEDEPILLVLDDFVDCAIEVDPGLGYMNVYMVFPYYDASKSERETGNYFDEIESDTEQYLRESIFKSFLQNNIPYMVTDWDDGCYMCPGYTARVGLYHVPCDVAVIKSFFDYTKVFYNTYDSHDSNHKCYLLILALKASLRIAFYIREGDYSLPYIVFYFASSWPRPIPTLTPSKNPAFS